MGHTSQRNRKHRHIIDLAGEANGCLARHETCETIAHRKEAKKLSFVHFVQDYLVKKLEGNIKLAISLVLEPNC